MVGSASFCILRDLDLGRDRHPWQADPDPADSDRYGTGINSKQMKKYIK
jgi:hypothetical protein